ncbi:DUF305 domain-containing protein [Croceibacterium mercuriale]|uniref:DUF305 domain-containing protein n=1 Tax=Croceibacterium mercuriale TaxID=1572751 RepID=UPI00068B5EFF|nr:DUF305 domain-containing protein [Croceibacterium mercuriale]
MESKQQEHGGGGGHYGRFMAMVGTSTFCMFLLMYLNTYSADHIFFSETRFWMTFVMGAVMAVVMLLFMWSMYKNTAKNFIILGVAVVTFSLALWLVRSQETIDDVEYMKAMIPHHSIAIMTSERAHIRDPRTRELARDIIIAQRREIAEMKYLIEDIEKHGVRTVERMPTPAELGSAAAPVGSAQGGAR